MTLFLQPWMCWLINDRGFSAACADAERKAAEKAAAKDAMKKALADVSF